MRRATFLATPVLLTLAGCATISDSQINPFNWFGSSAEETATAPVVQRNLVPEGRITLTVEGRPMVQSVTSLNIDRSPGGAIVRAVGIAPTQGFFNAELVDRGVEDGVLTLEFRAEQPNSVQVPGSDRSRQINAAYVIESNDLLAINSVRVVAATNVRTSRR